MKSRRPGTRTDKSTEMKPLKPEPEYVMDAATNNGNGRGTNFFERLKTRQYEEIVKSINHH